MSSGTGSGTLGLNLNDNDSIVDGVGNKLGGTGTGVVGGAEPGNDSFAGEVYTIDRTLTPQITADNKVYNGNTTATLSDCSFTSALPVTEDVDVLCSSPTFDNANAGTRTVTANVALTGADASRYVLSSSTASDSADITPADQAAVTVTAPGSVTFGATGTAAATGGSSTGAFVFSHGASTGCSVSGTTVSVSDASGTCALTAYRQGDSNYNDSAVSASFPVTLNKASQAAVTVTAPSSVTYGTPATATAEGGSGTGAFSFSAGASTGCSVVDDQVSVTNASLTCALTATRAGDNNHLVSAESASFPVTLLKATQSAVTVTAPASVTFGTPGTAMATGGDGTGAYTFDAGESTGCTVSGDQVTVTNAAGTCDITATRDADDNYDASAESILFSVTLNKAAQAAVTVTAPSAVTYGTPQTATATGGSTTGAFTFSTGASTGCSVTGDQVEVTDASGTCALTATRAGDDNYEDSAASESFPVTLNKAAQAPVTVTAPSAVTYGTPQTATATGGSTTGAFTFSTGASTGCSVTGDQVEVTDASGTCALTATRAGDNNYEDSAASESFPVTLNKATSTTDITCPTNVPHTGSPQTPCTVSVTGAGGLNLSPAATYVNNTDPGTATASYTYAGDTNHTGSSDSKNFTIDPVVPPPVAFCFTGFLGPIGGAVENAPSNGGSFADPVKAFKLGSTIPVKFLLNAKTGSTCGAVVTTGIHTLQAIRYGGVNEADAPIDATPTDGATSGNQFRLTGTEWHFNLSTKGLQQGTWLLRATLQDGSVYTVWITIKK